MPRRFDLATAALDHLVEAGCGLPQPLHFFSAIFESFRVAQLQSSLFGQDRTQVGVVAQLRVSRHQISGRGDRFVRG